MCKECRFWEALKWNGHTAGMCCAGYITRIIRAIEDYKMLLILHVILWAIRANTYNSSFQKKSSRIEHDVYRGGFQPTFIVQEWICHNIAGLLPQTNQQHTFVQIHIIGTI